MKKEKSRKQNRVWILLNAISLISALVLFYGVKIYNWPLYFLFIEIVVLTIFIISFYKAFIVTKFWKMVHNSSKNLDEREMQVVLTAVIQI